MSFIFNKVKNRILGNKIFSECNVGSTVGSYGISYQWQIIDATIRNTKQRVSIFQLKLKNMPKLSIINQNILLEQIKSGIRKLEEVKHPSFLKVLIPMEETNDEIVFATEPIFGSLGSFLKLDSSAGQYQKVSTMEQYEVINGIEILAKGIDHLASIGLAHGCINPNYIVVTTNNELKFASLDFSFPINQKMNECLMTISSIDTSLLKGIISPPESENQFNFTPTSDIYNLGYIACCMLSPNPVHIFQKPNANEYDLLIHLDDTTRSFLSRTICKVPESRLSAKQILSYPIFSQPLNTFTTMSKNYYSSDKIVKERFFPMISEHFSTFPALLVENYIAPIVLNEILKPEYADKCIPLYFQILKQDPTLHKDDLQKALILLCESPNPKVNALLMNETEFLIDSLQWQEFDKIITSQVIRNCMSPENSDLAIVKLLLISKNNNFTETKHLSPFLNLLLQPNMKVTFCVLKIISDNICKFHKDEIIGKIIPMIMSIQKHHSTLSLAILGFFQSIHKHYKDDLESDFIAYSLIPFLLRYAYAKDISQEQFKHFSTLITKYLKVSEEKHLQKLPSVAEKPKPPSSLQETPQVQQSQYNKPKFCFGDQVGTTNSQNSVNQFLNYNKNVQNCDASSWNHQNSTYPNQSSTYSTISQNFNTGVTPQPTTSEFYSQTNNWNSLNQTGFQTPNQVPNNQSYFQFTNPPQNCQDQTFNANSNPNPNNVNNYQYGSFPSNSQYQYQGSGF